MEGQNYCAHCEEPLLGDFCHQCGQKKITGRFTIKKIVGDVLSSVANLEKGFLATTKDMLVAPGTLINNYLNGNTVNTFRPFRFALVWATLSVIISLWVGVFDAQQTQMQGLMGVEQTPEQLARQAQIQETIRNFLNLIILTVLPFTSAVSWLMFRKHRKNYAEHLVINTFILGEATALSIILYPLYYFIDNAMQWAMIIGTVVNIFYYGYVYARTFKEGMLRSILKSIVIQILAIVLVMGAAMILGIIISLVIIAFKKVMG